MRIPPPSFAFIGISLPLANIYNFSFPLRAEVESHNNKRLRELPGQVYTYHSMDSRGFNAKGEILDKEMAERLLERLVARPLLTLKVGSQVMLIKVCGFLV